MKLHRRMIINALILLYYCSILDGKGVHITLQHAQIPHPHLQVKTSLEDFWEQ